MQRLRTALTPLTFYTGVALLSAGLIMLARWPYALLHIARLDLASDATSPLNATIGLWPWLERWSSPDSAMIAVVAAACAVLLAGLGCVVMKRSLAGGVMMGLAALAGSFVVPATWIDLRLLQQPSFPVFGGHLDETSHGFFLLTAFAAFSAVAAAASWILLHRAKGTRLRISTWVAMGLALAPIAFACVQAMKAIGPWFGPHIHGQVDAGPIVFWPLAPMFAAGIPASLRWPLYSSRLVSLLFLLVGGAAAMGGLAVTHDLALAEDTDDPLLPGFELLAAGSSCEPVHSAPAIWITEDEIFLSGKLIGRARGDLDLEAKLEKQLRERLTCEDLHAATADEHPFARGVNVFVQRGVSTSVVETALEACRRTGLTKPALITVRESPGETWTLATTHRHPCAGTIDLSSKP